MKDPAKVFLKDPSQTSCLPSPVLRHMISQTPADNTYFNYPSSVSPSPSDSASRSISPLPLFAGGRFSPLPDSAAGRISPPHGSNRRSLSPARSISPASPPFQPGQPRTSHSRLQAHSFSFLDDGITTPDDRHLPYIFTVRPQNSDSMKDRNPPSLRLGEFYISSPGYLSACREQQPLLSTRVFMCTSKDWQTAEIKEPFESGNWKLRFVINIPSSIMDELPILQTTFTDDYFKLEITKSQTCSHQRNRTPSTAFTSSGLVRLPGSSRYVRPSGRQLNLFLGRWENINSDDYSRVDLSDICGEITLGLDMDKKCCTFLVGNKQTYVVITHLPEKVNVSLSARIPGLSARLVEVSRVSPLTPIIPADPVTQREPFCPQPS